MNEAAEHGTDECQGDHGLGDIGAFLIALAQAPPLAQPSEGAINHPAAWNEDEIAALEAIYPLVFLDVIRVKIRDEGLVRNKAIHVAIGRAWRRTWQEVIPFFAFPCGVRRTLYTTNAIEALNSKLRRAVRAKGHFPNDEAALNLDHAHAILLLDDGLSALEVARIMYVDDDTAYQWRRLWTEGGPARLSEFGGKGASPRLSLADEAAPCFRKVMPIAVPPLAVTPEGTENVRGRRECRARTCHGPRCQWNGPPVSPPGRSSDCTRAPHRIHR